MSICGECDGAGDNLAGSPCQGCGGTGKVNNRFIDLHHCAVSGEMPHDIQSLSGRCEIGEVRFDNDDMSLALKFAELLWRRLRRLAEHYEAQSDNYMPGDTRGPMMAESAKAMRFVLSDVARDL